MTALWAVALLAPLLAAAALLPARTREAAVLLAPAACLPALGLAAVGERAGRLELPWLLLSTRLELDGIGRPLLAVTALLYAVALAASRVERTGDRRRAAFFGIFLVTCTGNFLLLVAADVMTFYVGFTVMSLAAYGLVAHHRTKRALRAARVYLGLAVVGEALLLAGLLLAVRVGGTELADIPEAVAGDRLRGLTVGLLIAGLGVKAGLVPLHVWLPLAHPAAPAPASAVLSGAMVKAGLVGWLRLLPLGAAELAGAGTVLVWVGLAGVFLAVAVGLTQQDPKVQLAYSTVGQMGFLAALVGAALREPAAADVAVAVAVVYAAVHGLAKGGLFLAVPVWHAAVTRGRRWLTLAGVAVGGLTIAGLPPLGGFVAKYGLKEVAESAGVPVLALSLGAVGTTLLVSRFAITLAAAPVDTPRAAGVLEAGWLLLLLTGPALVWVLASRTGAPVPTAARATVWAALWPVLLALAVVGATVLWLRRRRPVLPRITIPEGDLVVMLEPAAQQSLAGLDTAGRLPAAALHAVTTRTGVVREPIGVLADRLTLPSWRALGPLSLVALFVLAVTLL